MRRYENRKLFLKLKGRKPAPAIVTLLPDRRRTVGLMMASILIALLVVTTFGVLAEYDEPCDVCASAYCECITDCECGELTCKICSYKFFHRCTHLHNDDCLGVAPEHVCSTEEGCVPMNSQKGDDNDDGDDADDAQKTDDTGDADDAQKTDGDDDADDAQKGDDGDDADDAQKTDDTGDADGAQKTDDNGDADNTQKSDDDGGGKNARNEKRSKTSNDSNDDKAGEETAIWLCNAEKILACKHKDCVFGEFCPIDGALAGAFVVVEEVELFSITGIIEPDWIRLNKAINDLSHIAHIVIHPHGTPAAGNKVYQAHNDWVDGTTYNLVISDNMLNMIITAFIPGAPATDPHAITVNRPVTISPAGGINGGDITLLLNMVASGRHFIVESGTSAGEDGFVLSDAPGATIEAARVKLILDGKKDETSRLSGGVNINEGGSMTLNGATIRNSRAQSGGGVSVERNGTFTMNGGEISGNESTTSGGGVFVDCGAFKMTGGTIINNTARHTDKNPTIGPGGGGGVFVNQGTFTMEGGIISKNTIPSQSNANQGFAFGGAVHVAGDDGKLTMTGDALITENNSYNGGGVVVSEGAEFQLLAGAKINDNTTDYHGGGVLVDEKSTFIIEGGEISGNIAEQFGGGVYLLGELTMDKGAVISGNKAQLGGGVYMINTDAEMYINDSDIRNNIAERAGVNNDFGGNGGGIYAYNKSNVKMSGGTITGNSAEYFGGGIYVAGGSTFTLENGEISGNRANGGGGAYLAGVSTSAANAALDVFNMSGGTISSNNAKNGGGIYLSSGTVNLESGEISGNEATNGGGVGVFSYGTLNMQGGTISSNKAKNGGGIYLSLANVNLKSGEISGNEAIDNGGGIFKQNFNVITIDGENFNVISIGATAEFSGNKAGGGAYWLEDYKDDGVYYTGFAEITVRDLKALHEGAEKSIETKSHSDAPNKNSRPFTHLANNYDLNFNGTGQATQGEPDWIRLNKAINDLSHIGHIVIHPHGTPAAGNKVNPAHNDWVDGTTYHLVISNNVHNTIITVLIPGAPTANPHAITVNRPVTIAPAGGAQGRDITLRMDQSAVGRHFIVGSSTSAGEDGFVLRDAPGATIEAARVKLILDGDKDSTSRLSGGVNINAGGRMTLGGATIRNSRAQYGGGMYVGVGGAFTMTGGTISNNTALHTDTHLTIGGGGGVFVNHGTFTMEGGIISKNTVPDPLNDAKGFTFGGAVHVAGGKFIMTGKALITENDSHNGGGVVVSGGAVFELFAGAKVSDNTANHNGGGVLVGEDSTFIIKGGEISRNIAKEVGGGVYLVGKLRMEDGAVISGNKAPYGGGVFMTYPFTDKYAEMSINGGDIRGNSAERDGVNNDFGGNGGGIYADKNSNVEMSGGTITGNSAEDYGGGIFVSFGNMFTLKDGGEISGNTAGVDGGGVFTRDFNAITIGADAMFRDNTAANGAFWLEDYKNDGEYNPGSKITVGALKALHGQGEDATIKTTARSAAPDGESPFTYLANNYDLNFNGTDIEEFPKYKDWERLNMAINATAHAGIENIVIHPHGKVADASDNKPYPNYNDWISADGKTYNLVIRGDMGKPNTITTVPIDGAPPANPHAITVNRPVTIAPAGGDITLLLDAAASGRHFIVESGTGSLGNDGFVLSDAPGASQTERVKLILDGNDAIRNDGVILDASKDHGGGIEVAGGGRLTLNGAVISNSRAQNGGGVIVAIGGTFVMDAGKISDNFTYNVDNNINCGGGVYNSGTFTMNGGEISGNDAFGSGGGVHVAAGGKFTIVEGEISENGASRGGGVYVAGAGTSAANAFNMSGGKIRSNNAWNGGGVYVMTNGRFTMSGGEISGNKANGNGNGGGLYAEINGVITVEKGKIIGNTASRNGGGIFVQKHIDLTTSAATVFSGNKAHKAFNFGLAEGLEQYPAIKWKGQNSLGGAIEGEVEPHVINNYDVVWTLGEELFTVTFMMNDDSVAEHAMRSVEKGKTLGVNMPAVPVRPGYAFAGWNTEPDGSGDAFTSATTVNDDLTVYAKWTDKTTLTTLAISKTVSGAYADKSRSWTFTVYLVDSDDKTLAGTFSYAISGEGKDTPITGTLEPSATDDGSASFTLKHGQKIVISDIPIASKVQIVEEPDNNYKATFIDSDTPLETEEGNDTDMRQMSLDRKFEFTNQWIDRPHTGVGAGSLADLLLLPLLAMLAAVGLAVAAPRWRQRSKAEGDPPRK